MATVVKTRIVKIGNSQGIRIPKLLLDQSNLGKEVELEIELDHIIIRPAQPARAGWKAQFQKMAEAGDDYLLDEDVDLIENDWDEEEWEW